MKKFIAVALLLLAISPAHAGLIFGPLTSGSSQTPPPTGTAPIVTSLACTVALPVTNATNVNLVGGGSCAYTATCNSAACTGMNAITGWAITTQSTANSFSITNGGILQGGSAAGSVTTGSYTVTVTATNTTGTSPGVVQSISVFQPPVVASLACSIKSPITNNTNVTLQAGGNCQYTATCGGGACSGANAISGWSVVADTCTGCYQVTSSGVLQGSTNAGVVTNQTDTVTVVATNAGGNSPNVAQTVTAVTVPHITNQNFSKATITNPQTIGTMAAAPAATSWAITATSSSPGGASTSDFAISSGGVITTTSSAPTDVPNPSTVTISMTATNATGTSPTGTGTITVGSAACPQGSSFADGCPAGPGGTPQFPTLLSGGAYSGQSWVTRPPWNVAGVDYAVASIAQITAHCGSLTDWQTLTPSGNITWSGTGHNVNISGTNTVATCFDFSLHGGAQIIVSGASDTISWSNMKYGSNALASSDLGIIAQTSGSALSIIYNVIDGNGAAQPTSPQSTLVSVSGGVTGTMTLEYNLLQNFVQHVTEYNVNNNNAPINYKYNLIYNGGSSHAGPHLNYHQLGNNNDVITSNVDFNTTYQPVQPAAGGEGFQSSESSNSNGTSNGTYSNNTMIYGPNGEGKMHIVGASAPGNTLTANANYIDWRGGSPWYPCGGAVVGNNCHDSTSGIVTYTNNINPVTGGTIPAQ